MRKRTDTNIRKDPIIGPPNTDRDPNFCESKIKMFTYCNTILIGLNEIAVLMKLKWPEF